jgi:NADH-quinone oxidoreductase subunit L
MPTYSWLLLALPLASCAVILFGLRQRTELAGLVATASAGITLIISLALLGQMPEKGALEGPWFAWASAGDVTIKIGLLLDPLAVRMMLVVTGVGFLVHVFSLGYMQDDDAKGRYFGGLSLFMFSMTGIVIADNFLMTFIFWELVGLSSYLLIGHWYKKHTASKAANKAFLTNRVGDFGFMIGILLLWGITGHFDFAGMNEWNAGSPEVSGFLMNTALLCIFCGAIGKSAQVPLHVWLPDAMEGPTPVSALIHAATMVAAGVYMLVRVQVSLTEHWFNGAAGTVIATIGGVTALLAALIAIRQDDIKRILAYSTLSQLGYMVMAVGCLAGAEAMFHLYTHAWFKALLFLGSGAVIHACHHQQDIWKMGGLAKRMPVTTICFAAGTLALVALPGTSGFFSKEAILSAALKHHPWLFWLGAGVAALTTFYMLRLFFIAFLGAPRSKDSEHAKEVGLNMRIPLIILAVLALISGFGFIAAGTSPLHDRLHSHGFHFNPVFFASFGALLVGAGAACALYCGRDSDILAEGKPGEALAAGLGIDKFYAALIRWLQDGVATVIHFFDEFLINGMLVGGFARTAESFGLLVRRLQGGNLQVYAFLIALGAILVICFTAF